MSWPALSASLWLPAGKGQHSAALGLLAFSARVAGASLEAALRGPCFGSFFGSAIHRQRVEGSQNLQHSEPAQLLASDAVESTVGRSASNCPAQLWGNLPFKLDSCVCDEVMSLKVITTPSIRLSCVRYGMMRTLNQRLPEASTSLPLNIKVRFQFGVEV